MNERQPIHLCMTPLRMTLFLLWVTPDPQPINKTSQI